METERAIGHRLTAMAQLRSHAWAAFAIVCVSAASLAHCLPAKDTPVAVISELGGCAVLLEDGTCAIADAKVTKLNIWISSPAAEEARWTLDGTEIHPESEPEQGGRRFVVPVDGRESKTLRVTARGLDRTIRLAKEPSWQAVVDAQTLQQEGKLDEALVRLEQFLAVEQDAVARSQALSLAARIHDLRGRTAEARRRFEAAIELDQRLGRSSSEGANTIRAAFILFSQDPEFSAAYRMLERAHELYLQNPHGAAHLAFVRGLRASWSGDLQNALAHYEDAERRARRVGFNFVILRAGIGRAELLQSLGRGEESEALFAELEKSAQEMEPCERMRLISRSGWAAHLRAEAAISAPASAGGRSRFLEALALLRRSCPDRREEVILLVDLALDSMLHGPIDQAELDLKTVEAIEGELHVVSRLEVQELRGLLALARGQPKQALLEMERLKSFATVLSLPDIAWRAELGRAAALEALGRMEDALEAFEAAESILTRQGLRIMLSAGRGTFFGNRERGARRMIDFLLRIGRESEACAAARRSRLRAIRDLERPEGLKSLPADRRERWGRAISELNRLRATREQVAREMWELAENQRKVLAAKQAERAAQIDRELEMALLNHEPTAEILRSPKPGEVLLVFHPLEKGWMTCAVEAGETTVRRTERSPPDPFDLLEPHARLIAGSRRLLLATYDVTRKLDFHALDFGGRPLGEIVPVAYTLDLSEDARTAWHENRAVIIADPGENLIWAKEEGRRLEKMLRRDAHNWSVDTLFGSTASLEKARRAVASARLFHFAGHGDFAGSGGWRGALLLASDDRLSIAEVLALERVPEIVVLSGCETVRPDPRAPQETLGSAQAFLLAGSRAAIGAMRPVSDKLAAAMSGALYAGGVDVLITDPAAALARAQRELRAEDPGSDWSAFRALVR